MTALEAYAKLEAEARYFDGVSAEQHPVILSFGERSLIIMGFDDRPIDHWPLATLRALGQPGEQTVQLVPDLASDERVVLEDHEMIAAIRAVCPALYHRPADRRGVRRVLVWGTAALASAALIVLFLVPSLADQLADYVPPEREQALGDALAQQIGVLLSWDGSPEPGQCVAGDGSRALSAMTRRLDPPGTPYPIRVSVIDHSLVNAAALPGGRILLFRGLIDEATSPEEVAGVLAHEIGHVVHRDSVRGVLRASGTAGIIGILLGDIFGAAVLAAGADAVLNASHQREAERRADEAAHEMLVRAGLPTTPFARFFERMHSEHGDAPEPLEYLANHPGLRERAEQAAAADRIGESLYEPVLADRDWLALRNICDRTAPL